MVLTIIFFGIVKTFCKLLLLKMIKNNVILQHRVLSLCLMTFTDCYCQKNVKSLFSNPIITCGFKTSLNKTVSVQIQQAWITLLVLTCTHIHTNFWFIQWKTAPSLSSMFKVLLTMGHILYICKISCNLNLSTHLHHTLPLNSFDI